MLTVSSVLATAKIVVPPPLALNVTQIEIFQTIVIAILGILRMGPTVFSVLLTV